MKRQTRGMLAFALLFMLFLALVAYLLFAETMAPPAATQIAVVVYGEEAERWKALDAGVGKACSEWGMEKPVLVLLGQEGPEEQMRQIESAVANGAQGLLVAACHSGQMQAFLEKTNLGVPVVMVETGAGETLETVQADNGEMGRQLAAALAGETGLICVPAPPFARQSVEARYAGFMEKAKELGLQVEELAPLQGPRVQALAAALAEKKPRVLVMFDNESTELAIEAADAAMVETELYGVGSSDKALHATDTGAIRTLCFADEYAVGYMATGRLAARMGLHGAPAMVPVPFVLASQENMFTPPMEKVLFPSI